MTESRDEPWQEVHGRRRTRGTARRSDNTSSGTAPRRAAESTQQVAEILKALILPTEDHRRRRADREAPGAERSRPGRWKQEWLCTVCNRRNYLERLCCRQCTKQRDEGDTLVDKAGRASTAGAGSPAKTHASATTTTAGATGQAAATATATAVRKEHAAGKHTTGEAAAAAPSRSTAVREAETAVAAAKRAGFAAEVVTMLEEQLDKAKQAARAARPLGAQLDSARARCEKADAAAERCKRALEQATERLQEAQREKQQADEAYGSLMLRAATAGAAGAGTDAGGDEAADVLALLIQAVETTWQPGSAEQDREGLPPALAAAMDQARRSISKSPRGARRAPPTPDSDDSSEERGDEERDEEGDQSMGDSDLEPEREQMDPQRQPRRRRTPPLPREWASVMAEREQGSQEEQAERLAAAAAAFRTVAMAQAQAKRRRMESEA